LLNSASRHDGVFGSGGIDPRILNLNTIWNWTVILTPRPLLPPKKRMYISLFKIRSHSGTMIKVSEIL